MTVTAQPVEAAWRDLGPADLAPGQHRGIKISQTEYILLSNVDGAYYAIDDWCNHGGCLLSRSKLQGDMIVCHCHYAEFNARTGALLSEPRICDDQAQYELKFENERVWGRLKSGAPAQPAG